MAATDQRQSRARAREERRGAAAKRTSEQSQAKEEQQSMQDDSSSNNGEQEGHKSGSTAKLVLAGAAVGALLGTVKSVASKRRAGSQDEAEQVANGSKTPSKKSQGSKKEASSAKQRAESGGEGGAVEQSSLRGMALSVLEAAVEGLKNPPEAQANADTEEDDQGERSRNDEEDEEDEEADSTPHGERSEADDSSPRGSAEQTRQDQDDDGDEEREEEDDVEQPTASTEDDDEEEQEHEDDEDDDARAERSHPSADSAGQNGHSDGASVKIARQAVSQIAELIGRQPESVSGFERRDDGLHLAVEVVELERIPNSTDVIASYDVAVDDDGRVLEYARTRRYYRNRAEEEF
jgi:Gas vesicle synthesis protein GvpO